MIFGNGMCTMNVHSSVKTDGIVHPVKVLVRIQSRNMRLNTAQ